MFEQVGLYDAIPSCVDLVTAADGTYTDEGRLLFPRSLVEDTLAMAARNFVLHGQAPGREMELAGGVHVPSAHEWKAVLEPVVEIYRRLEVPVYFRVDAAFAMREVYEYLEGEQVRYAIRIKANTVLEWSPGQG